MAARRGGGRHCSSMAIGVRAHRRACGGGAAAGSAAALPLARSHPSQPCLLSPVQDPPRVRCRSAAALPLARSNPSRPCLLSPVQDPPRVRCRAARIRAR
uniref:Uncharacterized protein n=1 Tax=Oryza barthii TaxID=65489 RepID=A0A0D3GYL6_9ORYZ